MNRPQPSPRLQAMFDDLNERYFAGILDCKVVIGRLPLFPYLTAFPHLIEESLTDKQRAVVERVRKEDSEVLAQYYTQTRRIYFDEQAFSIEGLTGIDIATGLEERLRRIVLHEMCHAAVHRIEGIGRIRKHRKRDPPHGPKWRAQMERLVSLGETWADQEIAFYVVREAAKEREAWR